MAQDFQGVVCRQVPKLLAVVRNYLGHAKEMGQAQPPTAPIVFAKPWTSLAYCPTQLSLKCCRRRVEYEVELGVWLRRGGKHIPAESALQHVGGYFLAIDFTDRGAVQDADAQKAAKDKAMPWLTCKGEDGFCPVSAAVDSRVVDPYSLTLELRVVRRMQVNGVTKQKAPTKEMHFPIEKILASVSECISWGDNDLLLTGTPEGVGPVQPGDRVEAYLLSKESVLASLDFTVVD